MNHSVTTSARHTHVVNAMGPDGLRLSTERIDRRGRGAVRLDVYDSIDPTALLHVTDEFNDERSAATVVLDLHQLTALRQAIDLFLQQYGG